MRAVWVGWVLCVLSALLVVGCTGSQTATTECTDAIGCIEVRADEPIQIAVMIVSSGTLAFYGADMIGAIEIAVADYGEIHGHDIVLHLEDSLCSPEGGQTAAQKIAAIPSVAGILGPGCSSAATAALPVISATGLSMISGSNTAPTLTNANQDEGGVWHPGYYRTATNDLFQGRLAAAFAYHELGARSVATVHDGSSYADKLQAVMTDAFRELGGEIIYQGAVNVGDTDMRPLLIKIASADPDLLFFPVFQAEGSLIVAQTQEIAGLEDMHLLGADALYVQNFPVSAGRAAIGMYITAPSIANEAYDELLRKWNDMHGGVPPSAFHANMYDAAFMLFDAIAAVTRIDAEGNLLIGKQAIRDYLNSIKDFEGITGSLTCGPTGDCATGEALAVYQITEEQLDGVWPPPVVSWP